jgi:hypothetical protein
MLLAANMSFVLANFLICLLTALLTIFLERDKMELVVLREYKLHIYEKHRHVHERKEPMACQNAKAGEEGVQVHLPGLVLGHLF